MICSRCGATNSDENTFCNECGIVLRLSSAKEEGAVESEASALGSASINKNRVNSELTKDDFLNEGDLESNTKSIQEQWRELEQESNNIDNSTINSDDYHRKSDEYSYMGEDAGNGSDNFEDEINDMMDFSTELSDEDRMHGEFSKKESEYHTLNSNSSFVGDGSDVMFSSDSKKKIVLWVVVVAIVIGVAAFLLFMFWPSIAKSTLTPQKYYAVVEAKNLKQSSKNLDGFMGRLFGASYNVKSEARVVSAVREGVSDEILESLKKVKYEFNSIADRENDKYKTEFSILAGEEEAFNLLMLEKEGKAVYSFPEIVDGEFVNVSFRWVYDILFEDEATLKEITGLGKRDRDRLAKELLERVVLSSISEENIFEYEEEIAKQKCDATSFTINVRVKKNMYSALALELESNQQLREAIVNACRYYNEKIRDVNSVYMAEESILTEEEIKAVPNKILDQLRQKNGEEIDDTVYKYVVFYSKGIKKQIIARRIETLDGFHVTASNYMEEKENVTAVSCLNAENGFNFMIENRYQERGTGVIGKLSLKTLLRSKVTPLVVDYMFEKEASVSGTPIFIGEIKAILDLNLQDDDKTVNAININVASAIKDESVVKTLVDISHVMNDTERLRESMEILSEYSSDYTIDDFEIPEQSTMKQEDIMRAAQIISDRLMKGTGITQEDLLVLENADDRNTQTSDADFLEIV